jgi:hypothetical protein
MVDIVRRQQATAIIILSWIIYAQDEQYNIGILYMGSIADEIDIN